MKQMYQNARKYFVEKYGLKDNEPFVSVAKKVVDESNGKILFDVFDNKNMAGQFLVLIKDREMRQSR
jgi:ATP-dependent RNA circularization protein (DNA/RNA ligase family)